MLLDDRFSDILFWETEVIYYMQHRHYYLERPLLAISSISDPDNAVLQFYPLIAALNAPDGTFHLDLMLIGSVLIWANSLLKWMFMGDRPFWWVKEVAHSYPNIPILRQTNNTCIANNGNPSAHVMVTSGILFVILRAITSWKHQCYVSSKCSTQRWYSCWWKMGMWILYLALVTLVVFSCVFNASHFPHQCIFGAILGGFLAKTVSKWNSEWLKKQDSLKLLTYSLIPLVAAFGLYWIQKAFGIDPQKSVRLAFKWCLSPYEISVHTTSVYSLSSSCGFIFGMGIALLLRRMVTRLFAFKQKVSIEVAFLELFKKNSKMFHVANSVGVLMSGYSLNQLQKRIPTESVVVFYLQHFVINLAAPILYLFLVPIALVIVVKKLKFKQD